jgi:hypothetical protein
MDYLKVRQEAGQEGPLWLTVDGEPLGIWGFNTLVQPLKKKSWVDFSDQSLPVSPFG